MSSSYNTPCVKHKLVVSMYSNTETSLAMSTLAIWCGLVQSPDVRSRVFSRSWLIFSYAAFLNAIMNSIFVIKWMYYFTMTMYFTPMCLCFELLAKLCCFFINFNNKLSYKTNFKHVGQRRQQYFIDNNFGLFVSVDVNTSLLILIQDVWKQLCLSMPFIFVSACTFCHL